MVSLDQVRWLLFGVGGTERSVAERGGGGKGQLVELPSLVLRRATFHHFINTRSALSPLWERSCSF